MTRARSDQYAARVNQAADLLESGLDVPEAMRKLADQHGISERQARRYAEQARESGRVEVPSRSTPITTCLPEDLIERLRYHGKRNRRTLSSIITQALEEFLSRIRADPRRGRGK